MICLRINKGPESSTTSFALLFFQSDILVVDESYLLPRVNSGSWTPPGSRSKWTFWDPLWTENVSNYFTYILGCMKLRKFCWKQNPGKIIPWKIPIKMDKKIIRKFWCFTCQNRIFKFKHLLIKVKNQLRDTAKCVR